MKYTVIHSEVQQLGQAVQTVVLVQYIRKKRNESVADMLKREGFTDNSKIMFVIEGHPKFQEVGE